MLTLSLGPLALPVAPLLLVAAVWAMSWLASRVAARGPDPAAPAAAGNAVLGAALIGLLAARLAYVALHAGPYFATPWSVLDVRDGGFDVASGVAAGVAWVAWRGLRAPALRRALLVSSLAAAAIGAVGLVVTGLGQARDMPALVFTELESGAELDLAQAARGRPVVVNLWASWCGPCREEMPMLAAAQQRTADVGFLFVNQGEAAGTVRAYLSTHALPLREVLLDAGAKLGPAIGSRGLPTTLFYDRGGRLVDAHFGVLNAAALQSRLQSLRSAP